MNKVTGDARYNINLPKWELIRLLASGDILDQEVWKERLYYPLKNCPGSKNESASDIAQRQIDFIKGAQLLPAVGLTKNGSVGAVFRKPMDFKLSSELGYLENNCDGSGKTLEQVTQEAVTENVSLGYGGLLTDFAPGEFEGTKTEAMEAGRFATISVYQAESILRIGIKKVGNINVVWSIVLCETALELVDAFTEEEVKHYRVLTYDDSSNYVQYVYKEEKGVVSNDFRTIEPKGADGQPLKTIPFEFYGSQSNDYNVDDAPLYPMATLNAKHVEYSAIRNESIRKLGPTMFAEVPENFDADQFIADNGAFKMGAGNAYMGLLNPKIVQPDPNDAALSDMTRIKEDILNAGALLITPQVSGLSTETVTIQKSSETAVLGVVVRNVESAMNLSLAHAQEFMGGSGENYVAINRDFIDMPFTPEARKEWAAEVMQGLVTNDQFQQKLLKHGEISEIIEIEPLPPADDLDGDNNE